MLIRDRQRGVTLIELIIGIVVLSIVITLGVPSYSTWIQNSKLRNTAESILNGLQLARAEAVSRNVTVRFSLVAGGGWTVCLLDGGEAGCTGETIQSKAAGEGSPTNVTIVAAPNITDINFDPMGRGTPVTINVDVNPTILPAADSRDLRVQVQGGNVRMCDPNVESPDSRAC